MATGGKRVAITGSSGFVGTLLMRGLKAAGHQCLGFDRFDGWFYRALTTRYFQPLPSREFRSLKARISRKLWRYQRPATRLLIKFGVIRSGDVNILDVQERWIERFRGCDAVIHLAAIPHPKVRGMRPFDFELINYWGTVNIFEAAVAAGVKTFIFASSGQVYDINNFKGWPKFPVAEDVADLVQSTTETHPYSRCKWRVEKFLMERSLSVGMKSVALRLEMPGIFGGWPGNLWTITSVENIVQAFDKALRADLPPGGYCLNICNAEVVPEHGDLTAGVAEHFPSATNTCSGTQALLDLTAARERIGFAPEPGGSYYIGETVF